MTAPQVVLPLPITVAGLLPFSALMYRGCQGRAATRSHRRRQTLPRIPIPELVIDCIGEILRDAASDASKPSSWDVEVGCGRQLAVDLPDDGDTVEVKEDLC